MFSTYFTITSWKKKKKKKQTRNVSLDIIEKSAGQFCSRMVVSCPNYKANNHTHTQKDKKLKSYLKPNKLLTNLFILYHRNRLVKTAGRAAMVRSLIIRPQYQTKYNNKN